MNPNQPAPLYLPRIDILALWRAAHPVTKVTPRVLVERGFRHSHAEQLAARDLVRFLPRARSHALLGHRGGALFALHDHHGDLRCVRRHKHAARRLLGAETVRGLVLANAAARGMLAGITPPKVVILAEGESDWLSWCLHASTDAPVIGLVKGSWTSEIADHIPDGCTVVIRTDHDQAGDDLAAVVGRSLQDRCRLLRSTDDGTGRDQHDLWRAGALPSDPREGCAPYDPPPERPMRRTRPSSTISPDPTCVELSDERRRALRFLAERDITAALDNLPRHDAARRVGHIIGRRVACSIFEHEHVSTWRSNVIERASGRAARRNSRDAFEAGLRYGQRDPYLPPNRPGPTPRRAAPNEAERARAQPPVEPAKAKESRVGPTPDDGPLPSPPSLPHQRPEPADGGESRGETLVSEVGPTSRRATLAARAHPSAEPARAKESRVEPVPDCPGPTSRRATPNGAEPAWAQPPAEPARAKESRVGPTPDDGPLPSPPFLPHQRPEPANGEGDGGEALASEVRPCSAQRPWRPHIVEALENGARAHVIHRRFFEPRDLEDVGEARVLLLSGMMGTFKTGLIRSVVDGCRARGEAVLYISARQRLQAQAAGRLDLDSYLDLDDVGHAEMLSICVNSLERVDLRASTVEVTDAVGRTRVRRFGAVIIDESEEVVRALYSKIVGTRSPELYQKLVAVMRCARQVVCADASLGPVTMQLVRGALDLPEHGSLAEFHLHNTYVDPGRSALFYPSKDALLNDLLAALIEGDRVAVFTTFAAHTEMIGRLLSGITAEELGCLGVRADLVARLRRERPELRVLTLTADSAGGDEQAAFLADLEGGTRAYDAIVYTGVMGLGVSIDESVDRVYGLVGAGLHTASGVMQGEWRFRNPRDLCMHMHIEARCCTRTTCRDELHREALSLTLQADSALLRLRQEVRDDFLVTAPENEAHYQLYLTTRAYEHAESNDLNASVRAWLDGWGIPWDELPEDDSMMARARRSRTHAHRTRAVELARVDEADAIDQADDGDREEIARLRACGATTPAEVAQLKRARLTDHLGRTPTRDEIEAEVTERLVAKTRRLAQQRAYWAGVGEDMFTRDVERLALKRSLYTSQRALIARVRVTDLLLRAAGFDPERPEAFEMSSAGLHDAGFVDWVRANASLVAPVHSIPADLNRRPAEFIRRVLRAHGIEMVKHRRRCGGTRHRYYTVDMSSWSRALAWSEQAYARIASRGQTTPSGVGEARAVAGCGFDGELDDPALRGLRTAQACGAHPLVKRDLRFGVVQSWREPAEARGRCESGLHG